MENKKLLLISKSGYSDEHDEWLESLLDKGYKLFSVIGKDASLWEDAMDWIAVGDGTDINFIITTHHVDESLEDVIEYVENFDVEVETGIDIVEI